jgi:hypothetical protein
MLEWSSSRRRRGGDQASALGRRKQSDLSSDDSARAEATKVWRGVRLRDVPQSKVKRKR